jgi:hypothetical protein
MCGRLGSAEASSGRVRQRSRAVSDRGGNLAAAVAPLPPRDGVRSPPLLFPC